MGVHSDITRRQNITSNFLILLLLQSFFPLCLNDPCFFDAQVVLMRQLRHRKSRIACYFLPEASSFKSADMSTYCGITSETRKVMGPLLEWRLVIIQRGIAENI